ncbi:MAG: SLC13 family permease [Desulfopila sp.]
MNKRSIHIIIGMCIMLFFWFLPFTFPEVTEVGMKVIGVFLGTLYLWITIDILTASLVSVAMVVFTGYADVEEMLKAYMNTMLVQMFFLMILARALAQQEVTKYIARFFLTLKINRGRPWVLAYIVGLGCFLMGSFVDWLTPILLFWPILYSIFDQLGYSNDDAYPRIMTVLVVAATALGFPVPPYMNLAFILINNYAALTKDFPGGAVTVPSGSYLICSLIIGLILLTVFVLFAKFVFRPDVSNMKRFDPDTVNQTDPLPPMTTQQRILSGGMVLVILAFLLPTIFRSVPLLAAFSHYVKVIPLIAVAIFCVIRTNNKPIIDIDGALSAGFPWPLVAMVATALILAGALTNPSTGVAAFLNYLLSPIFSDMSVTVFTIVLVCIAYVLTNFCNSFVISIILSPIVATYCTATGANAIPILMLLFYSVLGSALVTPSASPFAALIHGNDRLKITDKYGMTFVLTVVQQIVILGVGIPLSRWLIG